MSMIISNSASSKPNVACIDFNLTISMTMSNFACNSVAYHYVQSGKMKEMELDKFVSKSWQTHLR